VGLVSRGAPVPLDAALLRRLCDHAGHENT
jgi:hypothetical protein